MAFAFTGFGSLNFISRGLKGPTSTTEGLFAPYPTSFSVTKTTEKVDKFAFVPAGGTGVKQKVASFQAQQDWAGEMTFGVQSWLDLQFLYGQKAQEAASTTPQIKAGIVDESAYTITDSDLNGITGTDVTVTWADYDTTIGSAFQMRVITTALGAHAIDAVANIGDTTIVVDNGATAAGTLLAVGDKITIAGSTTIHTITAVTENTPTAAEDSYTITPALDDNKADGDLITVRNVVSLDNSGNTLTFPAMFAGKQVFYSILTTETSSIIGLTNPTLYGGFEFFGVLNTHGSSTRNGIGIYIPELILDGNFSIAVTGGDDEVTVPFTPVLRSGYSEPVILREML